MTNMGDTYSQAVQGSNLQNPTHKFASPGVYLVSLQSNNQTTTDGNSVYREYLWAYRMRYLNITFVDSATNDTVNVVSVQDDLGYEEDTINGTYSHRYIEDSTHTLQFDALGYSVKQSQYNVSVNMSVLVRLDKSSSNQNLWYSPKQVAVSVVSYDPPGIPVPNASISLAAIGSSLQDNTQLQTLYGIKPEVANEMMNGTLLMNTFTGMDGAAVFSVLSSIRYTATVTDPKTSIAYSAVLHPGLDPYTIWIGTKPNAVNATALTATNQTRLWISQPDAGNVTLNMQYQDLTGYTTNVNFTVKTANNMTTIYEVSLGNPGISLVLANHTHRNIIGNGYYWYYNATRVIP